MSTNIKTPGVYVKEINLFPPSVAQVATAVPAFLGYTQKALNEEGEPITGALKIKSFVEYQGYFGGAYTPEEYTVSVNTATISLDDVHTATRFYLYDAIRHYFDNGGGACYILSLGNYTSTVTASHFTDGISTIGKLDEPTLLVFPDAVLLKDGSDNHDVAAFGSIQQAALVSCAKMQDRFAILDVMEGYLEEGIVSQPILNFRNNIGMNNLKYGATYYPWLVSAYPVEINYRQLLIFDESDAPLTDYSTISISASEAGLVSNMQNAIYHSDEVLDIGDIAATDLLSLRADAISTALTTLEQNLRASVSLHKTHFTNYLNIVADTAVSLLNAENNIIGNPSVAFEVGRLKTDTDLQAALTALIEVEKNEGTIDNALAGRTIATIDGLYTGFGSGWLGDGVAYADIAPEADYPSTKAGALAAIDRIKAEVLPVLLEKYNSLLGNILFFEQQASVALFTGHKMFKAIAERIRLYMRTIPPSGAVAGIYAMVDGTRGVWKAPANVSISNVIGPAVKIDNKDQESLNVHETGKSVNALRAFTGKGTLVWGARTLAGNDNEWRYVSVRRFYNMVEESIEKATEPFVFESNDANTWVKIQVMIENFLTLQWRAGALQGAKTEDAFYVAVGLGKTMTAQDILEGRLIVEIGMAVVRPAEFIILRFTHLMAKS